MQYLKVQARSSRQLLVLTGLLTNVYTSYTSHKTSFGHGKLLKTIIKLLNVSRSKQCTIHLVYYTFYNLLRSFRLPQELFYESKYVKEMVSFAIPMQCLVSFSSISHHQRSCHRVEFPIQVPVQALNQARTHARIRA